jgi:hypothetical protein
MAITNHLINGNHSKKIAQKIVKINRGIEKDLINLTIQDRPLEADYTSF